MKNRADDYGVKSLLIMCDNEGSLGDPDNQKGKKQLRIITNGMRPQNILDVIQ